MDSDLHLGYWIFPAGCWTFKQVKFKIEDILKWTGGELLSGKRSSVMEGISIDSRTIRPGEIFLALPGKNYNGHDFIVPALERRAAGLIVGERLRVDPGLLGEAAVIAVPEPALTNLTEFSRSC
jgi:UDP-N-acetylmuramyl pentapeptide synthase